MPPGDGVTRSAGVLVGKPAARAFRDVAEPVALESRAKGSDPTPWLWSRRSRVRVPSLALTKSLGDSQGREQALIVLGDLNDEPTAATTQILVGPPGSEIDTSGFDRPDQGDGSRLWNLAPLIPAERRFSRVFRGRGELIDHILVSHALVQRADRSPPAPARLPRSPRIRPPAATNPPRTTFRS
jgi:hypothetical protein